MEMAVGSLVGAYPLCRTEISGPLSPSRRSHQKGQDTPFTVMDVTSLSDPAVVVTILYFLWDIFKRPSVVFNGQESVGYAYSDNS